LIHSFLGSFQNREREGGFLLPFSYGKMLFSADMLSDHNYITLCDQELPEDQQTIFILSDLTIGQSEYIERSSGRGSLTLRTLHVGLKGIINFKLDEKPFSFLRDGNGQSLPGNLKPWKSDHLKKIPALERNEIADKILAINEITEEEKKNFVLLCAIMMQVLSPNQTGKYDVVCWVCAGSGCQFCNENGTIKLKKSPNKLLTTAGHIYFKCYAAFKNYGIWPIRGGYLDQSSKFVKVFEYCDKIIKRLNDEKSEIEAAEAKLKADQAKLHK